MVRSTFLERYQNGEHVEVWNELMLFGEAVRDEPYYADALAVAAETMRRARHNVELLIRRLEGMSYQFSDSRAAARSPLSVLEEWEQIAARMEAKAAGLEPNTFSNIHAKRMAEAIRQRVTAQTPFLRELAAQAASKKQASKKAPLEDTSVFDPPGKQTSRQLKKLEKLAGGPLPLSLRAWYEQVGGVSLMGSHPVLNRVRIAFRWGGFPGWEEAENPPRGEISRLSEGLRPL